MGHLLWHKLDQPQTTMSQGAHRDMMCCLGLVTTTHTVTMATGGLTRGQVRTYKELQSL